MTLRIDPVGSATTGTGEWTFPPRPAFAGSSAYDALYRALGRYVAGEIIGGRSFLIAGHRGAGKTALACRVVTELREKVILDHVSGEGGEEPSRPLLVKLHGPSLLDDTPPVLLDDERAAGGGAADEHGNAKPAADAKGKPAGEEHEPTPARRAQGALVQITISLYRALAAETVQTFTRHAAEAHARLPRDQMELAGQLALDLDQGCDPALLRSYWSRLGRLSGGVLWPDRAKTAMHRVRDQGVREIVALATAAQVFQVCTGRLSYKTTEIDEAAHKRALKLENAKSQGVADFKALVDRLGSVGVGTGAAAVSALAGLSQPAVMGIGLGGLLLSSAAFSWSDGRTRNTSRKLDYSFIRDTSTITLDRDLPLVFERLRRAGICPVFVIDELDKVKAPRQSIDQLIRRLKHIVTDHGFFCFLTDRNYFEEIDRVTEDGVYPVEHSYYSERLFVAHTPRQLLTHVMSLIKHNGTGPGEPPADTLARLVFAHDVLQRSRLNFVDVNRRLSEGTGQDGNLATNSEDLAGSLKFQLSAVYQLAVDLVMRSPELAKRLEGDLGFAQVAADALYWPAREWKEQRDFVVDREALRLYLLERMAAQVDTPDPETTKGKPTAKAATALASVTLLDPDLDLLVNRVVELAEMLADFSRLSRVALADTSKWARDQKLESIVPAEPRRLVSKDAEGRYCFHFDVYGRDLDKPLAGLDAQALPPAVVAEINEAIKLVLAFQGLLKDIEIPLDDLVDMGLFTGDTSLERLTKARLALRRLRDGGVISPEIDVHMQTIKSLQAQIDLYGTNLDWVADALTKARHQAGDPALSMHQVARRAMRYLEFR